MRQPPGRSAAVLDANVLYPFLIRDVLLSLADAQLFRPCWTVVINEEWMRNLIEAKPEREEKIRATLETMNAAFPEAIVENYADIVPSLTLPDRNDRHVLAAAISAEANVIVTGNTRDFPAATLDQFGIEARTPDEFVLAIVELRPRQAMNALERMRRRYRKPSTTRDELHAKLMGCGLKGTAAWLRRHWPLSPS